MAARRGMPDQQFFRGCLRHSFVALGLPGLMRSPKGVPRPFIGLPCKVLLTNCSEGLAEPGCGDATLLLHFLDELAILLLAVGLRFRQALRQPLAGQCQRQNDGPSRAA